MGRGRDIRSAAAGAAPWVPPSPGAQALHEWRSWRLAHAGSASRDRLPSGIALCYIGVVACRIGTIVPSLGRVRLAVVIIAVIRIAPVIRIGIVSRILTRHPTTSRIVRCANPGASGFRDRRRSHYASPQNHRGTRRRETRRNRRHEIRQIPHRRGNRRLRHAALHRRDLAGRGQPRRAMRLRCSPPATFYSAGLRYCLICASSTPYSHLAAGVFDNPTRLFTSRICVSCAGHANNSR